MGELFRRTYTDKAGAEKVVARWYGTFTDGDGIRRPLPGAGLACVDLGHQTALELAEGILPRQKAVNAAASNNKGM